MAHSIEVDFPRYHEQLRAILWASQAPSISRPELDAPQVNGLITGINFPFSHQFFDVAVAQVESMALVHI
jgi:hypothetical protein